MASDRAKSAGEAFKKWLDEHPDEAERIKNRQPDFLYKWRGAAFEIRHNVSLLKREWEQRIGDPFPGFSPDQIEGVASWAGIPRELAMRLTGGQIYIIAMEAKAPSMPVADEPQAVTGLLPTEICIQLGVTTKSLNKYATGAGVKTPGKGKRNHRYSQADYLKICRYVVATVSDTKVVRLARKIVAEMESKSKDGN